MLSAWHVVVLGNTANPCVKIDFKLQAVHLGITKFCIMCKPEKENPYTFHPFLKVNFHITCAFLDSIMFLPESHRGPGIIQGEKSMKTVSIAGFLNMTVLAISFNKSLIWVRSEEQGREEEIWNH